MKRLTWRKRTSTLIVRDILRVAQQPERKTHILFKVGLSVPVLNRYLNRLLSVGLLEHRESHYRTTAEGEALLRKIDDYLELLGEVRVKGAEIRRMLSLAGDPCEECGHMTVLHDVKGVCSKCLAAAEERQGYQSPCM